VINSGTLTGGSGVCIGGDGLHILGSCGAALTNINVVNHGSMIGGSALFCSGFGVRIHACNPSLSIRDLNVVNTGQMIGAASSSLAGSRTAERFWAAHPAMRSACAGTKPSALLTS
jgi:hypothetical protein